jgi:ABC-type nitrate/sulfonate/bicarbonate transport system substrate-binding protein
VSQVSPGQTTQENLLGVDVIANLWIPWIAKEAKIFEKNGLDVEAVLLNGSGRTSQALLSGSLFAASVASPQVMLADLNGADLVNVAHGIGVQASRLMVKPEIRKVDDSKARRSAFQLGFGGRFALRLCAAQVRHDTTRGVAVAVGNTAERLRALYAGSGMQPIFPIR